jgi:hypothetical protein
MTARRLRDCQFYPSHPLPSPGARLDHYIVVVVKTSLLNKFVRECNMPAQVNDCIRSLSVAFELPFGISDNTLRGIPVCSRVLRIAYEMTPDN